MGLNWLQWKPDSSAILFDYAIEHDKSGREQRARYDGGRWPDPEIFEVAADGSSLRRLMEEPEYGAGWKIPFHLSPDGSQLVRSTCLYDEPSGTRAYTLRILDLDSGQSQAFEYGPERSMFESYDSADEYWAQWSPDGSLIAFVQGNDPSVWRHPTGVLLYVVGADGTGETVVYGSDKEVLEIRFPTWSPDGSRIAFLADPDLSEELRLYVIGADGEGLEKMSELHPAGPPVWSPDGSRLAFYASRKPHFGRYRYPVSLYTIASDGTDLRTLFTNVTTTPYPSYFDRDGAHKPSWSPDGELILYPCLYTYEHFPDESALDEGICTVGVEGNAEVLTSLWPTAVWSPDGMKIAIRVTEPRRALWEEGVIYVMNRDGTDLRVLVELNDEEGELQAAFGRVAEIDDEGVLIKN